MTIRGTLAATFGTARGVCVAALLLGIWPITAQAFFGKVGPELQVNTSENGDQTYPQVATDSTGGFLVVWGDGSSIDIEGQRYDSSGVPVGTEFRVNAEAYGFQNGPAVGYTPTGGFLVVWNDSRDGDDDVYGNVVVGTAPLFPFDTRMNSYTTSNQGGSAVAILSDGGAVVIWNSDGQDGNNFGIFGRRRSSLGAALGTEFQVNTYTPGYQDGRAVAARPDGGFVVAWAGDAGEDGSSAGVFARTYDSAGMPSSSELQVNTYTFGNQAKPSVASDASGGFVVVFSGNGAGATVGVFGRHFDSSGTALGPQFTIDASGSTGYSAIAADPTGTFMVAWQARPSVVDYYDDVFARRLDASGTPLGAKFVVSARAGYYEDYPSIAAQGSGAFVVTWQGYDDDGTGIFAQRFGDVPDQCPDAPSSGCRTAAKSLLLIKDDGDNNKDKLIWKWIKGESTLDTEFGDPATSRNYALCVYDADERLISADVPPSSTKWQDLKYKDKPGSADGIQKIILKPSASDNSKILVKGKGANLPDTTLGSLQLPVTAQLINDETSVCFEGVYDTAEVIKNDATQFKAKAQN
jgi:hypothetical protein